MATGRARWLGALVVPLVLFMLLATSVDAVAQPRGGAAPRIASGTLASVTDAPRYFELLRIAVGDGATAHIAVGDGIVYLLSGRATIAIDGESVDLAPGEGRYAARGKTVSLTGAGPGEAVVLEFLLLRRDELDRPATRPAVNATRIFRGAAPIPGLQPGAYDVNLAHVVFPAHAPTNAPHRRTGAALYYVLGGTGTNTIAGKAFKRRRGRTVYEPSTLVHQWGNPGSRPLELLIFNISPSGTPAVVPAG